MVHKNIHRTVLIRLVLAWLILSLALGAIVFYLEMEKGDALMLELAMTESRSFTDHMNQESIAHLEVLKQKAEDFLKSDFISVRVYDTTQRKILEAVKQERDEEDWALNSTFTLCPRAIFRTTTRIGLAVSRSCRCCCR